METHAHHLHKAPGNGFKHYFFEFFMLFLAVSLGFFVENIREHHVEKERAEVLAHSVWADIKKDTTALNLCIRFSHDKMSTADSFITLLHQPRETWNDTTFYRFQNTITRVMPFDPTLGTYEQMKSSGALRYFDQHLVDLLNSYDVQARKSSGREATDLKMIVEQFWPFIITKASFEGAYDLRYNGSVTHELFIADADKQTLRTWINFIALSKWMRRVTITEYERQLKIANDLLTELNKEYQLN